jgi:hypothetical protein
MALAWIALALFLWAAQDESVAPYVRAGDRVEQQFRDYIGKLDAFFQLLRTATNRQARYLTNSLTQPPPKPVVYGYQLLPSLVDRTGSNKEPIEGRTYSWPIVEGYILGELAKLREATADFDRLQGASGGGEPDQFESLVQQYRDLLANQRVIDQYIQYNRFWQRSIAMDRQRFDQMTEVYNLLKRGNRDTNAIIQRVLGKPEMPDFLKVVREENGVRVLQVPVYTDIEDDAFLERVREAIEGMWTVQDGPTRFSVSIEFRRTNATELYSSDPVPHPGDHIDLRNHAAHFPADGAVLTTGAESIYSYVGRFIALGAADVTPRTLAHEFGHVLGFRDGYIRGYREIGDDGFEISEIMPAFDDIMSSPDRGHVQAAHFRLLIGSTPPD